MPAAQDLIELAKQLDPERAASLVAEFGTSANAAISVLLGTAFPPLCPTVAWQVDALSAMTDAGFWAPRRRDELVGNLVWCIESAEQPELGLRELRRLVWTERARIALRELLPGSLGGAPIPQTARELSDLADAVVEATLVDALRRTAGRYGVPTRAEGSFSEVAVLGMGKLGGQELNAGSDIDLIFIYDTDEGQSHLSLHEHFTRVVRRTVTSIESPSEDGFIWRVDLRLRPEGSQGAVVNSFAAVERYYETWGRLWERAALLRARPIAGSRKLGAQIEREIITPFVYRGEVDPSIAQTLADLVERSRRELSRDPERDLKLGPGGIREAEFFVQALQLIWGGRHPTLRVQGTLTALARLRSQGLVSDREAREISEGYTLLRRLEHRVQWMTGIQTHELFSDEETLLVLARSIGLTSTQELASEVSRVRENIAHLFKSLWPTVHRERRRHTSYIALIDAEDINSESRAAASEQLFGSADVGEHLHSLARRPDGLLGELTRERYPELSAELLETLANCPDPEQAARYLRAFFNRVFSKGAYIAPLAENERTLRRFITVLGSSAFVGDAIVSRPDFADVILFGDAQVSDPQALVDLEVGEALRARNGEDSVEERTSRFIAALRVAKRRLMVEVAVADLAEAISTRDATRILSELADQQLRHAVEFELGPDARGLAVIALGKLGAQDIGYGSDLDVIFIYDPMRAPSLDEAPEYFARRAQRIIRLISELTAAGTGYELDTRLRPSGAQGMLVTSLGAFARYHRVPLDSPESDPLPEVHASGAAWERQALLRARFCAGDTELGTRTIQVAEQAAYAGGAPPAHEIHRLRQRMERELARERAGRYDLKTGRGGLLDVEFALQWLQMRHGSNPRIRTTDTLRALEALHSANYISVSTYEAFREGYSFLRRLEQRMHILHGTSITVIDVNARGLAELARRMGFQDAPGDSAAEQLITRYLDITRKIHTAYSETLSLP